MSNDKQCPLHNFQACIQDECSFWIQRRKDNKGICSITCIATTLPESVQFLVTMLLGNEDT